MKAAGLAGASAQEGSHARAAAASIRSGRPANAYEVMLISCG